jgi:hypothetical protein
MDGAGLATWQRHGVAGERHDGIAFGGVGSGTVLACADDASRATGVVSLAVTDNDIKQQGNGSLCTGIASSQGTQKICHEQAHVIVSRWQSLYQVSCMLMMGISIELFRAAVCLTAKKFA